MAAIVEFDPTNRWVIEISTGGDNELSVLRIYSEWKAWAALNPQWLQAMSVIGGDPLTPELNLGSTFFMENGWRIKPAELNHKLSLVGNLWTREPGQDVAVDTTGAFRVSVVQRVSNLVDASVSSLDLLQLQQAVYIDVLNGITGTQPGTGAPTSPSNNLIDAMAIAAANNLSSFRVYGDLTIDMALPSTSVESATSRKSTTITLTGTDISMSRFRNVTLTGDAGGYSIEAESCYLDDVDNLSGDFMRCELSSAISTSSSASCLFTSCVSESENLVPPGITILPNSIVQFRGYIGDLDIAGMSALSTAVLDLSPGYVTVQPACTGGIIFARGLGTITDLAAGAVTINSTSLAGPPLTDAQTRAAASESVWDTNMSAISGTSTTGATLRSVASNTEATIAKVNTL